MVPWIHTLPRAIPGESFNNLSERISELSGFATDRAFMVATQGLELRNLQALPKCLVRFCEATDNAYGTPLEVAEAFTQLPYFASVLLAQEEHALVQRILESRPGPSRPCHLPILMSSSPFAEPHCPDCDRRYGIPVVMRIHLPPYVSHCAIDGGALMATTNAGAYDSACRKSSAFRDRNGLEFSRRTASLFASGRQPGALRLRLVERLDKSGLRLKSGRYRRLAITDAIRRCFDEGFPDARLDELIQSGRSVETAIDALARPGRGLHPVYYLLLDWMLDSAAAPRLSHFVTPRRTPSERLLEDRLPYRERWLLASTLNPGLGRGQVRCLNPALWSWLYRNDKAWLMSHQTECRAPRPRCLDKQLCSPLTESLRDSAQSAATVLDGGSTRPVRRSVTRISEAIGLTKHEFEVLAKHHAEVRTLVDDRPAFVERRLAWAARELVCCDTAPSQWRVSNKACVRHAKTQKNYNTQGAQSSNSTGDSRW